MNTQFDVIIVGAGPAGSTCALFLADSGLKIALVEKSVFPRDKICGDALSGKVSNVMARLPDFVQQNWQQYPEKIDSWGVRFVAPNLKQLDIPAKANYNINTTRPLAFLSKRVDFDHFLFTQVKSLPNVKVFEDFAVEDIQITDESVTVISKNSSTIKAKLIVGADGAHSVVAKKTGHYKVEPKHFCAGLRTYYKNVTGLHDHRFIELHFLKEFLPGYFWIFPLPNGLTNVGVGMLSSKVSSKKINLKTAMKDIIAHHPSIAPRFKNAELTDDIKGFGLPLGSKKRSLSGKRYLLLGDAASLIDPFTGEGIANAMMSAEKAAATIKACFVDNNFSTQRIKNYDVAIYNRLWGELKLSHILQKLINYPYLFNLIVNRAHTSPTLRNTFIAMFENVDMRKQLSNPLFYLKLLLGK